LLTCGLFAFGMLIASLVFYQQFFAPVSTISKPYAISNDQAIRIALMEVNKEPDRDAAFLPNEEAKAKLVHITNDGIAFITDENSLADMWLYSNDHRFLTKYEGRYFWHVDVTTSNIDDERGYYYLIDANTGQVIGNDRNLAYLTFS
jgi:predicted small secreted protein